MFYTLFDKHLNREIYVTGVSDDLKDYWWNETLDHKLYGHTLWVHDGDFDIVAHEKQREVTRRQDDIVTTLKHVLLKMREEDDLEELLNIARKELDNMKVK